jgi:hypothetical protein
VVELALAPKKVQQTKEPSLGQAPYLEPSPSSTPFFFLVNFAITLKFKLKLAFKFKFY